MREKGDKGRWGWMKFMQREQRGWGTLTLRAGVEKRGWWKKTRSPQKGKRKNPSQVGEHSKRDGIKRFKKNEEKDSYHWSIFMQFQLRLRISWKLADYRKAILTNPTSCWPLLFHPFIHPNKYWLSTLHVGTKDIIMNVCLHGASITDLNQLLTLMNVKPQL